jgi:predicted signal transduction protein with EAL and GGDEF domain
LRDTLASVSHSGFRVFSPEPKPQDPRLRTKRSAALATVLVALSLAAGASSLAGETLYNGIVLPDTAIAGAEAIAERVRKRVEGTTLTSSGIRATVSIGIAALDVQDREYSVWIAHADRALYAAKERGRNRSVRYPAG